MKADTKYCADHRPLPVSSWHRLPLPVWLVSGSLSLLAVAAVWRDLFYFSDGAWFAFAVATGFGWDLFWADWPRRIGALLLSGGPAWLVQAAGGSPWLVGKVYQSSFYAVPLVCTALLVWLLPAHAASRWLKWQMLSFVTLGFGTFGFATEAWVALPLAWTVMGCVAQPPQGFARRVVALVLLAAFIFSHELALLTAPAFLFQLYWSWRAHPIGSSSRRFLLCFAGTAAALVLLWLFFWVHHKPSNPLLAVALQVNQNTIWTPWFLRRPLVLASSALAILGLGIWLRPRITERMEVRVLVVFFIFAAAIACYTKDVPSDRYMQRSAILWLLPLLTFAAASLSWEPRWKSLAWVLTPALALQLFVHTLSLARWEEYRNLLVETASRTDGAVSFESWSETVWARIPESSGFLWDWPVPYVSLMLTAETEPRLLIRSGGWYAPMTCSQAVTVLPEVRWLAPGVRDLLIADVCAKSRALGS